MNRNKTYFRFFLLGLIVTGLWGLWLLGSLGTGGDHIISDPDAYLHVWNLWWVQEALTSLENPYSTSFIGFPNTVSLTYHQLIFPLGLLSAPLFALGLHAGQVLLFWQYCFLIVGFTGMYELSSRFTDRPGGACLAALYFVFTPIFWENLPRPDSLAYVVFPWLVLAVFWSHRGSYWRILLPSIVGAFIVLMSPYYAVGWLIVLLVTLPFAGTFQLDHVRLGLSACGAFLLSSFEWGPQALGEGPNVIVNDRVIEAFSADVTSWILPHPDFIWMPESLAWWSDTWTAGIHSSIYLGWTAVLLGLVGLTRLDESRKRWALVLLGIVFVIALGPGVRILGTTYGSGFLPYGWIIQLTDVVKSFRIPLRFGYFVVFLLALGIARGMPERPRLSVALGVILLLELVRPPMQVRRLPDVNSLEKVSERVEEPAVVPVPFSDWATPVQFGQTIHRKKLHLAGLSYIPDTIWGPISKNPFLDALYNGNELPNRGIKSLERQGVGGVLFHYRVLKRERRERLEKSFRTLFGSPTLRTKRLKFYDFNRTD